jgi:hypothetical protein
MCPECGEGFSLAEYVFEENAVLFHCPHCDHGVEGDGIAGKPLMSLHQCSVCGLEVNHETFVIRPKVGVDVLAFGSLLPIRLKKGNWLTRYFSTVWLVMTKPQTAISRVPVQEPLWVAWKFMLTSLLISIVVGFLPLAFFFVIGRVASSDSSGTSLVIVFSVIQFVMGFLSVVLYAISWPLITHVLLHITGGSNFSIRRTQQAVLYGGGTLIVWILPCVGGVASFIWWLIATTNMLARGQRVHGSRATFASLMGSLLLSVFVCGSYFLLMYAVTAPLLATSRAAAQQRQLQQQSSEVEPVKEERIIE